MQRRLGTTACVAATALWPLPAQLYAPEADTPWWRDGAADARDASAGPEEPSSDGGRRRLFGGQEALHATSPYVRRTFIPRVAAKRRWRPTLAYRLLPKFLHVLDGTCLAFLLW